MKIKEIWQALDDGKTVNWSNSLYELSITTSNGSKFAKDTERGNKAIDCRCTDNYFGGYLLKSEFSKCYVKESKQ